MAKRTSEGKPFIETVSKAGSSATVSSARAGDVLIVSGRGLGETADRTRICFDEWVALPYKISFTSEKLVVPVPVMPDKTGSMVALVDDERSNEIVFEVEPIGDPDPVPGRATEEFFCVLDEYASLVAALGRGMAFNEDHGRDLEQAADYLDAGRRLCQRNLVLARQWSEAQDLAGDATPFEALQTIRRWDESIAAGDLTSHVSRLTDSSFGEGSLLEEFVKSPFSSVGGALFEGGLDLRSVGSSVLEFFGFRLHEHSKTLEGIENIFKIFVPSASLQLGVEGGAVVVSGSGALGVDVSFSPGEGVSAVAKGVDILAQYLTRIAGLIGGDPIGDQLDKLEAKTDTQGRMLVTLESKADKSEGKLDALAMLVGTLGENITLIDGKVDRQEGKLDGFGSAVERQEGKLDVIEAKEDAAERKLDSQEAKLDRQGEKLDVLETKADLAEGKLDTLEAKADRGEAKLDRLEEKADKSEVKLDALERKTDIQETKLDRIEEKDDKAEVKLDALERKTDIQETKLDRLGEKADRAESKLDVLERKADKGESKLDSLAKQVSMAEGKLDKLEGKTDRSETKLDRIERKSDASEGKTDKLGQNLDRAEQKLDVLGGKSDRVEAKLDAVEAKEDRTEGKLDRLERKSDEADAKLDRLESKNDAEEVKLDALEQKNDRAEVKLDQLRQDVAETGKKLDVQEGKLDTANSKLDTLDKKADKAEMKLDRLEEKADREEVKIDIIEEKLDRLPPPDLPVEGSIATQQGGSNRVTAAVAAIRGADNLVHLKAAVDKDAAELDVEASWSRWVSFGKPAAAGVVRSVSIDLNYEEGSNVRMSAVLTVRDQAGNVFHRAFESQRQSRLLTRSEWTDWQSFLAQP